MQLFGKYPAILSDDVVGEEATSVLDARRNVIILKEKKLTAKGIYGIQRIKLTMMILS
jgi:5-methyltetrahydrofolate--homocysteine methyltransferase